MSLEQLLAVVSPEHREDVRLRYAKFTAGAQTLADEHIDSFAKVLSERGYLTQDALHEFLTYRALSVRVPKEVTALELAAPDGGRYEIMTVLGRGGMGEVFLGSEPVLRRTVAIKRLHKSRRHDPMMHRRFVTEAQVTAQLDHPAIVPVYGLERDAEGTLAYAMKFVRGKTLSLYLHEAALQLHDRGKADGSHSLKARVSMFVPVLNALAYAHRRGVIHRDLKPENIMLGRFGEVLVMDWGIARIMRDPSTDPTATGEPAPSPEAVAFAAAPTPMATPTDLAAARAVHDAAVASSSASAPSPAPASAPPSSPASAPSSSPASAPSSSPAPAPSPAPSPAPAPAPSPAAPEPRATASAPDPASHATRAPHGATMANTVGPDGAELERDVATAAGLTRPGAVVGTPDFMSPEQARGDRLDAASDQFALGLILQEIATLQPARPARGVEPMVDRAVRGERAPIVESKGEKIPRDLRAIIAKATALDRHARYASVEAMADDVRRYLRDESVLADPDSGVRRVARWIGNHRETSLALGVGLVLLVFAVAGFVLWRGEVALAKERQEARARERAVMALGALVEVRAKRIIEQLHGYEMLLTELSGAARIYLTEPAPPSTVPAFKYRGGKRDPDTAILEAVESKFYAQRTSLRRADITAVPELDRDAMRPMIDRLTRLEPVLRATLLASAGREATKLPLDKAEELVLQRGTPIVWAYFGLAAGLSIGMPGTWSYEDSEASPGYDFRKEAWYVDALPMGSAPFWSSGIDENGLGLLLSCTQNVHDTAGNFIGVAAIDLAMANLIDRELEIPVLAELGVESLLLDPEGRVQVRSSQKQTARTATDFAPTPYEVPEVVDAIAAAESGHLELADGRLAFWTSLGRVGLTYLVVGAQSDMLALYKATPRAPP